MCCCWWGWQPALVSTLVPGVFYLSSCCEGCDDTFHESLLFLYPWKRTTLPGSVTDHSSAPGSTKDHASRIHERPLFCDPLETAHSWFAKTTVLGPSDSPFSVQYPWKATCSWPIEDRSSMIHESPFPHGLQKTPLSGSLRTTLPGSKKQH